MKSGKLPKIQPPKPKPQPEQKHLPKKPKEIPAPKVKEPPKRVKPKIPRNFEIIVQDADSTIDKSSTHKLYDQLYDGVFLNDKRKKFWVDKDSGSNSFMLFARDMSIIWSEDIRYWKWIPVKLTRDVVVDAAELLDVCWLEIKAKIDTKNLSPGISYHVFFVLMMKDHAYGWENPVTLGLLFSNEMKKEYKKDLREIKKKNRWIEIRVGEFITSHENEGKLEIFICGSEGLCWKKGIVIKGVVIRHSN